tara:strand:+ start:2915 stop:4009 length:1095 start_codon:yes stop_codon:yes gene_type:complete
MNFIFPKIYKKILITGGLGFIGGALIRRLLNTTSAEIFNIDKFSYASDEKGLENLLSSNVYFSKRYNYLRCNLEDLLESENIVKKINPDLIIHLAAESHVDRSINHPITFINSNIIGTFSLLEQTRQYWENLSDERKKIFRFHHISTDEVFGSLTENNVLFKEETAYDPRSPYSATKAGSDHLVQAWHHTYGIPTITTNCSNNFGPWQFPEKLIPLVILKAVKQESIPVYGNGSNIRDWLYVEDHIDAILLAACKGTPGEKYCIGGEKEKTNLEIVEKICSLLEDLRPINKKYADLINFVSDRPGHDKRYAVDSSKIESELNWEPKHNFDNALLLTVKWYLDNLNWCEKMFLKAKYRGERLGQI